MTELPADRDEYLLKLDPDERSWTARENLVDILERELLGPAGGPEEVLDGVPDSAYLIGRIAPVRLQAGKSDPTDADEGEVATDVGHASHSVRVSLRAVNGVRVIGTAAVLVVVFGLMGCGRDVAAPGGGATTTQASRPPTEPATEPATAPPLPEPGRTGTCPYLSNAAASDKNGQMVSKVRLSSDSPPACFFFRADGELQLQTIVFKTDPSSAEAAVDRAAPIDTSSKWQVLDWQGGIQKTGKNTVVAVAKEGNAVIVTTNQRTINATEVAEHVITTLTL